MKSAQGGTTGNIEARHTPTDGCPPAAVRIALAWTAKAPWQVEAVVGSVEWILSRDLLMDGLTSRTGLGDVVLRPVSFTHVELTLNGILDDGEASVALRLSTARLRAFLDHTEQIVPRGAEVVDFDAELLSVLTEERQS